MSANNNKTNKMPNEKYYIDRAPIMQFIVDGLNERDPMKNLGYDGIRILTELEFAPRADVVEVSRLGELGRLMMPYKGCPRGRMGARGVYGDEEIQIEFEVMTLDAIEDIEGDRWVPVLAEDLSNLKARLNSAVKVVHGQWVEYQVPHIMCCSECDWGTDVQDDFNYCPNCGAKMDGERRTNETLRRRMYPML